MMVQIVNVEGYNAFVWAVEECAERSGSIFVLFSGSEDENGLNWCPDCTAAKPVIKEGLKNAPDDGIFIHCSVGDRPYWKNAENEFRKNEVLKLTCVPTLIKWNTERRLEEEQCKNLALVTMLFET